MTKLGAAGAVVLGAAAVIAANSPAQNLDQQAGTGPVPEAQSDASAANVVVDGQPVPVKDNGTTVFKTDDGSKVTVVNGGQDGQPGDGDASDGDGSTTSNGNVIVTVDHSSNQSTDGTSRVHGSTTVRNSTHSNTSSQSSQSESTNVSVHN
ncbi:MAG TPA: hypothetical protein VLF67_04775 [Candidatus Saccharimonas sp.]|nr:hypothetical protein [Candidatus Saccharimonas sp.]